MIKLKTEAVVGMTVMGGFVLLAFIVFGISGIYFFRPGYNLSAVFKFVGIIDRGAPVRYAGVKIGEVKKVEIVNSSAPQTGNVRITFFVVEGVKIHENDKVSIQGTHIMSEPHIAIEPVLENPGRLLKGGDSVQGIDPVSMDELIKQGREITAKFNQFMTEAEKTFQAVGSEGMIRQTLVNMSELLASLNQIFKGNEEQVREGLAGLNKSATQLSALLDKVNRGEGTLGKLVVEEELYNDLRGFVKEIKSHPWRLLKK